MSGRVPSLCKRCTAAGAAAVGVVATVAVTATPARAATINTAVSQAVSYASGHGYHTSVAVLDRKTGNFWGAGDYVSSYASESIVKLFIATRLLVTGQMHGTTAAIAWKMITQSDDFSATTLYGRAGGDGVEPWVEARYRIPFLGAPPRRAGWWGSTRITAKGIVYFLARMKADRRVGPWLVNAMRHSTAYGSDHQFQAFGIPAATRGAAFKSGWGQDYGDGSASFNSTGLVNNDRYAVALLARGRASTYGRAISDVLTRQARILLPGGRVDNPADHNPAFHLDRATTRGSTVTFVGWAFDPDQQATAINVGIYEGSHARSQKPTSSYRPDVNSRYQLTGNHGFHVDISAGNGRHRYCLEYFNVGPGTANPGQCIIVTVSGSPRGSFDGTSAGAGTASVAGWAYDPDLGSGSSQVAVVVDGGAPTVRTTDIPRADVNRVLHISGDHGFAVAIGGLSPGGHQVCVTALNAGFSGAPDQPLGCRSVTVAASPPAAPGAPAAPPAAGTGAPTVQPQPTAR